MVSTHPLCCSLDKTDLLTGMRSLHSVHPHSLCLFTCFCCIFTGLVLEIQVHIQINNNILHIRTLEVKLAVRHTDRIVLPPRSLSRCIWYHLVIQDVQEVLFPTGNFINRVQSTCQDVRTIGISLFGWWLKKPPPVHLVLLFLLQKKRIGWISYLWSLLVGGVV